MSRVASSRPPQLLLTHKHSPTIGALLADLIDRVRRYGMAFGKSVPDRRHPRVTRRRRGRVWENPLLDGDGEKWPVPPASMSTSTEQFHADVQERRLTESVTEVSEAAGSDKPGPLGILMPAVWN